MSRPFKRPNPNMSVTFEKSEVPSDIQNGDQGIACGHYLQREKVRFYAMCELKTEVASNNPGAVGAVLCEACATALKKQEPIN
jgi:hypothetical protein